MAYKYEGFVKSGHECQQIIPRIACAFSQYCVVAGLDLQLEVSMNLRAYRLSISGHSLGIVDAHVCSEKKRILLAWNILE